MTHLVVWMKLCFYNSRRDYDSCIALENITSVECIERTHSSIGMLEWFSTLEYLRVGKRVERSFLNQNIFCQAKIGSTVIAMLRPRLSMMRYSFGLVEDDEFREKFYCYAHTTQAWNERGVPCFPKNFIHPRWMRVIRTSFDRSISSFEKNVRSRSSKSFVFAPIWLYWSGAPAGKRTRLV